MSILIDSVTADKLEKFLLSNFSSIFIAEKYYNSNIDIAAKLYMAALGLDKNAFELEFNRYFSNSENREKFKESVNASYLWESLRWYQIHYYKDNNEKTIFFIVSWPNILTKFELSCTNANGT